MKTLLLALLILPPRLQALCVTISSAPTTPPVVQGCTDATNPLDPCYIPAMVYSGPSWVWTADISTKVFRDQGNPTAVQVSTPSGTRGEIVPFQFFVQAPASGLSNLNISMDNFVSTQTGNSNATISTITTTARNNVMVYISSYVYISTPSATSTYTANGYYSRSQGSYIPDEIIPVIDPYYLQVTNALPLTVVAGNNQGFEVKVYIPTSSPSGYYQSKIRLSSSTTNTIFATIPVDLMVWDSTMNPTASRLSYSSPQYADMCIQQYGGPTNTGCKAYNSNAADDNDGARIVNHDECVFLLDHRWSCGHTNVAGDTVATMKVKMGHLLAGTTSSTLINPILTGARVTSSQEGLATANINTVQLWMNSFRASGDAWTSLMPFDYVRDEPAGSQWPAMISSMTTLSGTEIPYLVTSSYVTALNKGATAQLNIIIPTVENLAADISAGVLSGWKNSMSSATLGSYADCLSGANGDGTGPCNGASGPNNIGKGSTYPNPHIDGKPVANMALDAVLFMDSATLNLNSTFVYCWVNGDCGANKQPWAPGGVYYKGQGDETWLYPGTTAVLNVSTPIFVGSLRLDMSMMGEQYYEYTQMLSNKGLRSYAYSQNATWMTNEQTFNMDPILIQGSYSGTITSARQNMGCKLHQVAHPGASCGW